ncbi:Peptidase family M23 [Georgenia satyanarayanai]|uniref:Peptidase family M23 n=1 Tax=Georgenia satyanarayanai TaxID=860221 RepID=A0A2Y9ARB3_9MICO|nr:M23 family metallopeptidase [Georgenia satyanarayanai]PYF96377.1 peptidase M23-like protein [Georgenia satyanarayanai]SSA46924.1 Peptidase family M23 [Georgenia satyanarayanai]
MPPKLLPIAALILIPAAVLALVFSLLLLGGTPAEANCNPGQDSTVSISDADVPDGEVNGYSGDQLVNAAHILRAGADMGMSVRDQTIGVMTAMGESSLQVLDRGDAVGPDSRGLFQQRDNGAWGSYEDRMDPYVSATSFFEAMIQLHGRDSLEPTMVAHRVQRNADPFHYERYWDDAVAVVEALSGADTGLARGTGGRVCTTTTTTPGTVGPEGWALPADGPITSGYGMRVDPVTGAFTRLHAGLDFQAGGCEGPIWAAQEGTVIDVFTDQHGGWTLDVDHGGVLTRYKHMYANGILVAVGDRVEAGQQIARTGSSGWSTGCHLHFEVHVDGSPVDPRDFLAALGISL